MEGKDVFGVVKIGKSFTEINSTVSSAHQGAKRECRTCHKPYPELRFFKNGADWCNSCELRWERKQIKKMDGLKFQVADLTASPFSSRSPSPMSYSDGKLTEGFEPKLSSSSEKKKRRMRRTSSSRRIESDTEEEEAGGEEEEGVMMTMIARTLKSSSNRNQSLRRRVNLQQQTRMKKGMKKQ